MIYTFNDFYGNEVKFSFEKEPFSISPKHVWIICRFKEQWLLTHHRGRGYEFPGGNVEEGETPEEAAHREVMEETGATIKHLDYIAQYFVAGKGGSIYKNVYYAVIDRMLEQKTYYETHGPILKKQLPNNLKEHHQFSFMMKDEVVIRCLQYIRKHYLKNNE